MTKLPWRYILRYVTMFIVLGTLFPFIAHAQEATPIPSEAQAETTESCILSDDYYVMTMNTTLYDAAPGVYGNDVLGSTHSPFFVGPAANGTASVGPTGELRYTPEPGYMGDDSFVYALRCGDKTSGTYVYAIVHVTVSPAPEVTPTEAPNSSCDVADDFYSTPKDTILTVAAPSILTNDVLPSGGFISAITPASHGVATIGPRGELTYTPASGFTGDDEFTYTIRCSDRSGSPSQTATVYIDVEAPSPTETVIPPRLCPPHSVPMTTATRRRRTHRYPYPTQESSPMMSGPSHSSP